MRRAPAFSGAVRDYLPKPDCDPVPVEPGDFAMPTPAEINAAKLGVEQHKRQLLEAAQSAPTTHPGPAR